MSDPFDAETPSADEAPDPDTLRDPAELQSAGDLDEDELASDPLEDALDPPEQWSTVARERPTPREQAEDEDIDTRLERERPDPSGESPVPVGETRLHELDESVDERAAAQVADEANGVAADQPIEHEAGVVVGSEETEATGLNASSVEGVDVEDSTVSGRAPEEDAERVYDRGR